MRESGFGRALRYFIRQAEQQVLFAAGLSIAMAVYMSIINGQVTFLEMFCAVPGTMLYMSGMVLMGTGMSAGQQWYTTLISLGCRRKNIFLGNLVMDLLFIVECIVLFQCSGRILKTGAPVFTVPIIMVFYFIVGGVSKAGGAAAVKWGKIAQVVSILLIVAVTMALFVWLKLSSFSEQDAASFFIQLAGGTSGTSRQWQLAAAAAVVYAAGNGFAWIIIRNYEVRT